MFNYNTKNLANASLSEAEKVLDNVDASAYKHSVTGSKTIDQYNFTIDGKVVTPQCIEKGWYEETDSIASKDLEKMFNVQVGGITVSYGTLSFANSKANSSNELEANISKVLFAYWQAAESYLD